MGACAEEKVESNHLRGVQTELVHISINILVALELGNKLLITHYPFKKLPTVGDRILFSARIRIKFQWL